MKRILITSIVAVKMKKRILALAILLVFMALSATMSIAHASVITVCGIGCDYTSIQAAVDAAFPGDRITVNCCDYNETVDIINKNLILGGITPGVRVINGGIFISGGTVTVEGMTITATNFSPGSSGIFIEGGAIVMLSRITVSNKSAGFQGGGITNNGGIVTVVNSTISGNAAGIPVCIGSCQEPGGGIHNIAGTVTVINSTITNNVAGRGGGVFNTEFGGGTVNIRNTIIAGNTASVTGPADCFGGTINSQGHNLVGDGTGCPSGGTGDQSVDPADVFTTVLSPLQNNGGLTETHALLPGSPAIDQIPAADCSITFDQRGITRVAPCDVGAFEANPPGSTCPNDVLLSAFQAAPFDEQFVDVTNVGDSTIIIENCTLVGFNLLTEKSIGDATVALFGILAPGETFRVGSAGVSGVDAVIPDHALALAAGGLSLLDAPPPPDRTRVIKVLPDNITGMAYKLSAEVIGVAHLRKPAHDAIYACIYGGSGLGPFTGPFTPVAECLDGS